LMNNYKHATSPICYLSMFPKLVPEIMDLVWGSIFVLAILTTRHSICYPGSIQVKTFRSHFWLENCDHLRRCPNTIKIRRFEVSKFLKGRFSSRWTSKTSNH
jgi:hypothetical protein